MRVLLKIVSTITASSLWTCNKHYLTLYQLLLSHSFLPHTYFFINSSFYCVR